MTGRGRTMPKRAFTLLELLLAVSVSATIGTACASVLHAVAVAAAASEDDRIRTVAGHAACMRISALVRGCRRVTVVEEDLLALWAGDENGDGILNDGELRLVRWDAAGSRLVALEPSGLTTLLPAPGVAPGGDLSSLAAIAAGGAAMEVVGAVPDIHACRFTLAASGDDRMIVCTFSFGENTGAEAHSVCIRARGGIAW